MSASPQQIQMYLDGAAMLEQVVMQGLTAYQKWKEAAAAADIPIEVLDQVDARFQKFYPMAPTMMVVDPIKPPTGPPV